MPLSLEREGLAVGSESSDVVACKQLLHEPQDVDRVLVELHRVVEPGLLAA